MKPKESTRLAALVSAIAFAAGLSATEPTDFSTYSTDDLVQLRSQVQNMNEEDRLRFLMEMQRRARAMTPEQRAEAGIRPGAGPGQKQGPQQAQDDQLRDGTGNPAHGRAADHASDGRRDHSGSDRKAGGSEGDGRAADFRSYGSGYKSRRGQGRTGYGHSPHAGL